MTNRLSVIVAIGVIASACQREHAPVAEGVAAQASARRPLPLPSETTWHRGGRKADDVLRYPEYLAHDLTRLYVTDRATHQVFAFDQRTGALRWASDTADFVLRDPTSIAGLPAGGVAVLDRASRNIVLLDGAGRARGTIALSDGPGASQICIQGDSTFLVSYQREQLPLVHVDRTGQVLGRLALPWPATRGLTAMQTQLSLASDVSGRCVASLVYGEGLAAFRNGAVEWTTPYVERIGLPRSEQRVTVANGARTLSERVLASHTAARDVTADEHVVDVLFDGATEDRGRLIDEYDAATGAYLRTHVTGRRIVAMQRSGDRGFLLAGMHGYPTLVAIAMRAPLAR